MKTTIIRKPLWILAAALAILVGLYPILYFTAERFGLLKSKPDELVSSFVWYSAFYTHITLGGLALLIGWLQFSPSHRNKYISLHRLIGKVYVIAVLLSASAGFYISFYAMGGVLAASGFASLAVIWFYTTLMGYITIRRGQLVSHQRMVIYSYACCFAAVTLRLWLPILAKIFGNFETAYVVVAWWCWVPNLAVAYFLTRHLNQE